MVTAQRISLSLEEFLQLPETKPASEYINGEIIQKPIPQGKHSRLQGKLVTHINQVLETSKTGIAFTELRCTFGDRSLVPDVTVFSWERIPTDEEGDIANVFKTAPDWTIEILSPGQNQMRVISNIIHCLQHGTKLGWLIDPEVKMILAFIPNKQPVFFEKPEDVLPVPEMFAELSLTLGAVFGWLKL